MIIIVSILLFVTSLAATIGANDTIQSSQYNTDPRIRSAQKYLAVASGLGWTSLIVLIVILTISAVVGGFTTTENSDVLLSNPNPTKIDIIEAYKEEKELSGGNMARIIVFIILIIISIIIFIVGILSFAATVELGYVEQRDEKSNAAYTKSIISTVASIGCVGIMIISVFLYNSIRSDQDTQLQELRSFQDRIESDLGIVNNTYTVHPALITPITHN
jgi:ABC-type Fe3+ transport system permease subunit